MKWSAYTSACAPVVSGCPAYCETTGIMLGVISVPATGCANADAGGNVICCSDSWLCTLELAKLYPHMSSPPATRSTTTISAPPALARTSKTLRRMTDSLRSEFSSFGVLFVRSSLCTIRRVQAGQ